MPQITVRKSYADTPEGQIHYAEAGQGKPVLLLHQTPRSWDEYRDVLPILGRKYRVIAMDTIGFGDSYRLKGEATIEVFARGVIRLMDALSLLRASVVGHHSRLP
jgi:pimeloyl-ACP methyl ester carboxylesterase